MKFQITDNEKKLIEHFKKIKYPAIYKLDATDNILFVELIDFDICSWLLKGKSINRTQYKQILKEYSKYLEQVKVDLFDKYALEHYNIVIQIMELFKKYYNYLDF